MVEAQDPAGRPIGDRRRLHLRRHLEARDREGLTPADDEAVAAQVAEVAASAAAAEVAEVAP